MEKKDDLLAIERIIGYHFFEPQHLIRALTHPAYANELIQKNRICLTQEAYSTLGDAVLKTSLILFLMEKGLQEKGSITQTKEQLEDNTSLAKIGRRLKIKKFIRLGRGEKELWRSGEETILADTIEAIIGAIFLDSDAGLGVVRQCIGIWFEPELDQIRLENAPKKKVKNSPSSSSGLSRSR
ncbi:ribonuclease III domain-containing protein [Methanoregula sp.]|jgi:ribonuclease-3|uniref:ribonuclease III domain-containing protein n=1 Tax=Methanoregula sp. TaxID=2052170 RepID=UPI003C1E20B0